MANDAAAATATTATSQRYDTLDDLPPKALFPKQYISQYKAQMYELAERIQHLIDEADDFAIESESTHQTHALNDFQLAALTRETVWHNLTALRDCESYLENIVHLFHHKIHVRVASPLELVSLRVQVDKRRVVFNGT